MDLNLKYRMGVGRLIAKRDKTFGELTYNTRYPIFLEQEIDQKNEKKLKLFELESKKRLLPLEMEATPSSIVNKELRTKEIEKFTKKQSLPRRAVEQTAKRMSAKQGEAAANAYRKEKLNALDKKLEDFTAQLLAKYPETKESPANPAAVTKYENAVASEAKKRAELETKLQNEKNAVMQKAKGSMSAKNSKLQATLDETNKQLGAAYESNSKAFPSGMIMSIKNMKMHFSGIKALDDLSFDIKEDDIFGLIGPNGAGKTTLFNCITQFYKATDGVILYRDRFGNVVNLGDYHSHDVAKTGIIRTFQNLALVPLISVMDNLMIGAHIYYNSGLFHQFLHTKKLKYEEKAIREKALDVLERLNLLPYKDYLPLSLSYGVLKKVELARTLMSEPRMIILDEPAAGLNDAETEELAEVIRKIRGDFKCTIFLVEHDMNLVMNVCDTVCAISFGKMLGIGTPTEIQSNPAVQQAYLGAEEEH